MTGKTYDLFIIGGGVNGCGIARDAAGRGLSVGLAEMGDLGGATSSASSKLIHGGLRYLEFFEFGLVRKALIEREVLLAAMPHIAWPMRFVLPHHKGLRPRWMLRAGLFLYDHLGGRKFLPATRALDLRSHPAGRLLKPGFRHGYEYSDGWVQDARLVVLNARDAQARGAEIMVRTKVVRATRHADHWEVELEGETSGTIRAKTLVNAAGPWVGEVLGQALGLNAGNAIRLVRGSHIVVPRLAGHEQPYILQGSDGRIVFLIPYEEDFTLIGTTEAPHQGDPGQAECSDDEAAYLVNFVNDYLATPISVDDVVWRFAGVRPLVEDGASSATAATRDYVLDLDTSAAPVLHVFGGKITTFRKLAEAALEKLGVAGGWTKDAPLPGGDFPVGGAGALADGLREDYPFLTEAWARRLVTTYGTEARVLLGAAKTAADLGRDFSATLTEAELRFLIEHEFARTGEDVLWRRTKLGLRLDAEAAKAVDGWMREQTGAKT